MARPLICPGTSTGGASGGASGATCSGDHSELV